MTTLKLDIEAFPKQYDYWCERTKSNLNLPSSVYNLQSTIELMMQQGILARRDSFGFAMADFTLDYEEHWDSPETLIAFVAFWGPKGRRCAANAIRKIRPAAREGMDTQFMRLSYPELFCDQVESEEEDGTFTWGDFPYDGAVHLNVMGRKLLGACSTFPKEQDPIATCLALGVVGLDMHNADQLA